MPPEIVDSNDYQIPDWPTTPEGEARQAAEYEEMYSFLFGHPLVEALTGWDFADGAWLGAPSGVIRKDNSIKPVYNTLKRLIKDEWTTELSIRTDEGGYAEFTGYRGIYGAETQGRPAEFQLDKSSDTIEVII